MTYHSGLKSNEPESRNTNFVVWAHNKINKTCKDDPTRHGTRREKQRQTEEEIRRQHSGMDTFKLGKVLQNAKNREGWRKVVARSYLIPERLFRLRDK